MKYGELNLGQIEAIVNKLGGMKGVNDLLSGKISLINLKENLKVWKKIKIGTHKNMNSLFNALKEDGIEVPVEIVQSFFFESELVVSKFETEVELVNISIEDLGFKGSAFYKDICSKAKELGLSLCSYEMAFQLRLQYKEQPENEHLTIMSKPIFNRKTLLNEKSSPHWFSVFRCENTTEEYKYKSFAYGRLMDDSLRLRADGSCNSRDWVNNLFTKGDRLVFCFRK